MDFAVTIVRSFDREPPPPGQVLHSGRAGSLVASTSGVVVAGRSEEWACVAVSRLDNRTELQRELGVDSGGDNEAALLLACHQRWPQSFPARLLGEFAFVFWHRVSGEVLLGVDCFAHHPLFYLTKRDQTVCIDTDLAHLTTVRGWDRTPDERALVDYLAGFSTSEGATGWCRVRSVPAGHIVRIHRGAISARRYWRPEELPPYPDSPETCGLELRAELSRAVRQRVAQAGTTAVLLSGGLDSSAIACLAAEARPDRVLAVSGAFTADPSVDERVFQRAVVNRSKLNWEQVPVLETPAMSLGEGTELYGHPFPVGGHWIADPCLARAAKARAGVVLTGLDGDRVVSHGHGCLAELTANQNWSQLALEVVACSGHRSSAARQALGLVAASMLPRRVSSEVDLARRRRTVMARPAVQALRDDALRRTGALEAEVAAGGRLWNVRDHHLRALMRSDRSADLEVMSGLQRRHGVAARHPFFDRRVVELCLSFPAEQKRRRGIGRWVLRDALRGVVPESVRLRRDKAEFDGAFAVWAPALFGAEQLKK